MTIVFAPLTSSPETVGESAVVLPALTAYGQEAAGGYGIIDLPRLTTFAAGSLTTQVAANGTPYLPAFSVIGFQSSGGFGVVPLPALSTYGQPPSLVPQAGSGTPALPALTTEGTGYRALNSDVALSLRPLWVYGQQAAGGWGIVELPRMGTVGVEMPASPNFFSMAQSAGYLLMFAAETQYATLDDSAAAAVASESEVLANLVSRIALTNGLTAGATFNPSVTDSASFTDTIRSAWSMLLADTAAGASAITGTVYKAVAIAEAIAAVDAATPRLTAYAAVAIAASLEDMASNGWNASAVDQAALTDAATARMEAMLALADAIASTDAASGTMFLTAILADVSTVVDSPAAALRALANAESSAMLYVSLRLGTTDYHGWAMNTDAKAFSEHRSLQFDSLCVIDGRHFAAGPMGIVELTGHADDGADIDASVIPFLTDFGTQRFKRLPEMWIGADTAGALFVKVLTRDPATGAKLEDWYTLTSKQGANSQPHRAEIGRGLKSTFWGLALCNVDGADFRLREIVLKPVVLDRRS